MASRLALLAVLLASSRLAFGSFIVETALLEVLSPNNANFTMAVANFGNPLYGGTLRCVGPTLLQPWQTQPQGRQTLGASCAPEGLSFTSPLPWCHPYDTRPPTPAHARVSRFHSSPRGEVQYLRQERYACTALQARAQKFPGLAATVFFSASRPCVTPARPSADATGTTGTLRKQQRAGDARHRAGGPGWCVAGESRASRDLTTPVLSAYTACLTAAGGNPPRPHVQAPQTPRAFPSRARSR
jgi:hypothetical protein